MSLSTLIFLALGFGIAFGAGLHEFFPAWVGPTDHYLLDPLGQIFLRLIQFVVVPLVFSSLILALTRVKNAAEVGRYAVKLLGGYVVTTTIAVVLGMGTAIVLKSGEGMVGIAAKSTTTAGQAPDLIAWLVSLIPTNPLEALSTSNLLQTILSAALIGIGMQQAGDKAQSFADFVSSVYEISEKILIIVLYISPVGVFALMASVIANAGFGVIINLFSYVLGHIVAVALMIAVYTILLLAFKISPWQFFKSFTSTYTLAFGTASSNAALPVAMQEAQDNYKLPLPIASFAIPLGTAVKRDGSAIMEGFSAIFIAQLFQIPLTGSLLLSIFLSTLLVSFSTAGVPGSGLVMMTTVLTASGLPVEGVAIVAGVNRLADGFCTMLNLIGNTTHAALLAKWEGLEIETLDRAPVEIEG
ncbi:dicarboxylate/amino acid:cation symporter [filamentous cyanobacterium LEGE 11480]|uniref:Dicarboxylate/amino acid:cation symporter n=1 Tax=Romeriopsis navalis LEGE 11480 TaxID=2777977 RepID=A0A928VRI5_9CYAN|nr:dicarboxylate/amino acid:cation symporter [Romeriopsis navalis]MBE9030789.1 dicarboxylate/amino acid:cation symporter [Romeriopsis navalis LEGE 11480]